MVPRLAFALPFSALALAGCISHAEYYRVVQENEQLKAEIASLQAEQRWIEAADMLYGVSMDEGLMSVMRTGAPWLSSSMRRPSVKAFTACLEAEYWVWRIMARSDRTLPTLTMVPP